jgi:hypothetical protein
MLPTYLPPEKNAETNDLAQARKFLETDFAVTYIAAPLREVNLLEEAVVEVGGHTLPATQNFLESLATNIGMPTAYAYDIDFDLFQYNFTRRKAEKDHPVRVCVVGDRAVGLAPGDYRPAVTTDVLDALPPINEKIWKLQKFSLSDRFFEIDLLSEDFVVTPKPGDEIRCGIRITNSETGDFGLRASLFTYRLVCSNGAVMRSEFGTVRWNYDKRMTYVSSIAKFASSVPVLWDGQKKLKDVYAAAIQRPVAEEDVLRLWRRIRTAGKVEPERADMILGISSDERHRLSAAVAERRAAGQPAQASNWDEYTIHNRITDAAKAFPMARRSHLERIGGDVLGIYSLN